MKILHVIGSCDPAKGGPVEAIRQASTVLAHKGHPCEIACLDPPAAPWLRSMPVTTHALGPGKLGYGYAPRLRHWLEERGRDYDCVICHGLWEYPSLATWQALRKSSIPYFVYVHGMLDPSHKQTFPIKHLKKTVYWALAEHRVLRDARAVLFTCALERDLAQTTFRPYRCSPSIVHYCVGSPDRGAISAQPLLTAFPELRGRRLFLFLGRIHPKKGCDLLLEAFAPLAQSDPSLHLVMAGPDWQGWTHKLQHRAKELGLGDRITWTGMLLGELKWSALGAAEVFVLPTYQENFGIAIVEALAAGTPVLITDRVNIWPEIQAAGAALVAGPGQAEATRLLRTWSELPELERTRMRGCARACFTEHYQSDAASELLLTTLRAHGVAS